MKNNNYIVIQGWMINELKLKGNLLIIYATIYGFSQDGLSEFTGSLNYLTKMLGISKPTVVAALKNLENSRLIIKSIQNDGNKYRCNLSVINNFLGSKETLPVGSKETLPVGSKETLPNNNNIYIYSSSKEKFAEISENIILLESIARKNKLKIDTVRAQIQNFLNHSEGIQSVYNNRSELFQHFSNWIRKQNLKDTDVAVEFSWFMKMFNEVSKRDFVPTVKLRQLFATQLANGYTGEQMLMAVKNLYSTSEKNKWHRDKSFVFATPEHLLSGENLNKYLNARYS